MFKHLLLAASVAVSCPALADDDKDKTAPGLVQQLFVGKEHIIAPTGISVSPEGVVFVSCDVNATTTTKLRAGKVIRCEDTDGDGKADKFSNFVEGIDSPRGSCYVDDTLYLVQPPYLIAYEDPNGDGVAEKKTALVSNLGLPLDLTDGVNHGQNGVRMGIDGWLYLAIGDQGCFETTGTDGSKVTLRGGGLLRVRPDGSQLAVLLTGTRNIYDVAVDPYLNLFARDNTNDGGGWNTRLHYLTELADFGYPHLYRNFGNEHMQSLVDYGSGAGTGMYYLHEPGFPKDFGDALYSGDFNTGVAIHRRKSNRESFQIQQEAFMDLPKNTGMDADGFSRMYFSSWQDGGFGFADAPFGGVYLVQPENKTEAAEYPDINKASDADLIEHLSSPSQVARINAMREMVTRGNKPAFTKGLAATAENSDAPLYARVAAVMTLKQLDGAKSHSTLTNLYKEEALREFAVRALSDVAGEIDDSVKKICLQALQDENPRVQMRAIVALERSGDVKVAEAILPLAAGEKMTAESNEKWISEQDEDGWSAPHQAISHTALRAVVKLNAVDLLLSKLDDSELRETALRGLQQIHSEEVVAGLAAKVAATKDKQLARLITLALFRLYHKEESWDGKSWWGTRPNFRGPYYSGVPWDHTPAVKSAIETAFKKVDSGDYAELFEMMRMNQVPEAELSLDIKFDEALALLSNEELDQEEYNMLMAAVDDGERPEEERIKIYNYFKKGEYPDNYLNRVHILRLWGEGKAEGELQRKAYKEFVSGDEFIGRVEDLEEFLGNSEKDSYKYAHIQLINLINNKSAPQDTRKAALAGLDKTWADKKNIYPHRLRGLMLAFEEIDPSPYAKELKPLVEHRDERVKQGAERYLGQIK